LTNYVIIKLTKGNVEDEKLTKVSIQTNTRKVKHELKGDKCEQGPWNETKKNMEIFWGLE